MNLVTDHNSLMCIAAVGMYDGVHCGHKFLIENLKKEASRRGLRSAVVTFRNHPLAVISPQSAPKLLSTFTERMNMLDATGIDDCIILDFDNMMRRLTAEDFISMLHYRYGVKVMMVGFNNRFGHNRTDGIEQYRKTAMSLDMDIIEATEFRMSSDGISSSVIRRYLSEGKTIEANEALGYCYFLSGTVIEGKKLGRTIGFPTANIFPDDCRKLIPKPGVYAAHVITDGYSRHNAMVNIGYRPTVDTANNPELSIEAHILDFSGNLYNKTVTVEFLNYMRDERRFDSIENLRIQLLDDRNDVIDFISHYA